MSQVLPTIPTAPKPITNDARPMRWVSARESVQPNQILGRASTHPTH